MNDRWPLARTAAVEGRPALRARELVAVAALFALALALRFAYLADAGEHMDEVVLWRYAMLGRATGQEPPLLVWLSRAWIALTPAHDIAALRFPAAALAALAVPACFALAREVAGTRVAVVAAGFVAAWPAAVFHAHRLRPYGLLLVLVALVSWALLRSLREGSARSWALYAAALAATCATHLLGTLLVAPAAIATLVAVGPSRVFSDRRSLAFAGASAVGLLGAAWTQMRTAPGGVNEGAYGGPVWRFASELIGGISIGAYVEGTRTGSPLALTGGALVLVMAGLGARVLWRAQPVALTLFVGTLLTVILFLFATSGLMTTWGHAWTRYLIPAFPSLAVLAATGAEQLARRHRALTIALAVVVTPHLIGAGLDAAVFLRKPARERKDAALVAQWPGPLAGFLFVGKDLWYLERWTTTMLRRDPGTHPAVGIQIGRGFRYEVIGTPLAGLPGQVRFLDPKRAAPTPPDGRYAVWTQAAASSCEAVAAAAPTFIVSASAPAGRARPWRAEVVIECEVVFRADPEAPSPPGAPAGARGFAPLRYDSENNRTMR